MPERFDIVIKVVSQGGRCDLGHKVGQEWLLRDKTPEGICIGAFHSLYPDARVLMYGGSFPWSSDPDTNTVACPDPVNPVVFEIRRVRRKK